jgi:very-short-patch-repair endonuclease
MSPRIPLPSDLTDRAFGYADARAAGVGEGRLRGPDLARPFHGTRMDARHVLSLEERCRAYMARMPESAFFCSVTAAALWGIPLPTWALRRTDIDVAVISPARALRGTGIVGHKVQPMGDDVHELRGMPLSSPVRTWLELAAPMSLPELVAAGDHLVHWRAPTVSQAGLPAAIGRFPGRRGKPLLREAVLMLDDRAESPMESTLRVGLLEVGIQGLVSNHPVRIGSSSYRIDLALPKWKVAIEYQGDYHRERDQWRRDMTRISRLESAGWVVVQINADDLRDLAELRERIRRIVASRPDYS